MVLIMDMLGGHNYVLILEWDIWLTILQLNVSNLFRWLTCDQLCGYFGYFMCESSQYSIVVMHVYLSVCQSLNHTPPPYWCINTWDTLTMWRSRQSEFIPAQHMLDYSNTVLELFYWLIICGYSIAIVVSIVMHLLAMLGIDINPTHY